MLSPKFLGIRDVMYDQYIEIIIQEGLEDKVLIVDITKYIFENEHFVNSIKKLLEDLKDDLVHYIKKKLQKWKLFVFFVAKNYNMK